MLATSRSIFRLCKVALLSAAMLVFASHCRAAVTNDILSWALLSRTNYIERIATNIQVRIAIVNGAVSPLVHVATNRVFAGYQTTVSNSVTNVFLLYTNIVTTNAWAPFEYAYSDSYGSYVGTGFPRVTTSMIRGFQTKVEQLVPHFVATNWVYEGTYSNWFDQSFGETTNHPTDFPRLSIPALFTYEDIGHVPLAATNDWGHVTSGTGHWTRALWGGDLWLLGQATWTNAWGWRSNSVWQTGCYQPGISPVLFTSPGLSGIDFQVSITGSVVNSSNSQAVASSSETVPISGGFGYSTQQWHSVSGLVPSSNGFAWGDAVVVAYTSPAAFYGPAQVGRLYAAQIDELRKAVDALRVTGSDCQIVSYISRTKQGLDASWPTAVAEAESGWVIHPDYHEPGQYTRGWVWQTNSEFTARRTASMASWKQTSANWTGSVRQVQFYVHTPLPGAYFSAQIENSTFHPYSFPVAENRFNLLDARDYGLSVATSQVLFSTNPISEWCQEPTPLSSPPPYKGAAKGFQYGPVKSANFWPSAIFPEWWD